MQKIMEQYREFNTPEEVQNWIVEHYPDILNIDPKSHLYKIIFFYTGNSYKILNHLLRVCPPIGSLEYKKIDFDDYTEEANEISIINDFLYSHTLIENIVAYRFTHLSVVKKLCNSKFLHKGLCFSDKAFFSTTLVRELLGDFSKDHRCSCVLKLYLQKGIHGAYVSLKSDQTQLNEQEFLLPPNTKFEIIKVHYFKYPMLIECKVILD